MVGHIRAAEIFNDEADGDGEAGFDDPHAGRVADEDRGKSLPGSVFLHPIKPNNCFALMITY